ncbi:ABC transporter permease [Salidesulfovibrio onnuriiensis]|uniref:ABC transporter permease n=1 Tax=Salidesulfovibrio onnuriiensis TaxID=2583823 RepID=UPI001C9BE082|nr:FtsX-like permease family protein [Salidesulfovibrio onnuriiensis]
MEILMAWRNVWRNPRRSILTILAIAFACLLLVFMLSFQFGMYEVMINAAVKMQTGHLQVVAEGYDKDMKMRWVVQDPQAVAEVLQDAPHVTGHTFRANGFALLSSEDRTYGGMVTGVDPARETAISTTHETIREGSYLAPGDTNQAIVGSLLAKNLHVAVGDELVLLGNARDGSIAATVLTVKGIFSSGMDEYDRSAIQIPLGYFQEVFAMRGAVHQVVAACDSLPGVYAAQKTIIGKLSNMQNSRKLECKRWDQLMPGLIQSIQMDLGGGVIFYLILIVVVAFSIMNTFLMAVFERTHEFGTLMAIGAQPGRLTRMLLYESAFLTFCGIALGIAAGCALTLYLEHTGMTMGQAEGMLRQYGIPNVLRPKLSWITAVAGPFVVFCITMLTALYPAFKVRRLKPVEAMHAV